MTEPIEQSASLDPGRTRNRWPFDVFGLPAITVPCGFYTGGPPDWAADRWSSVCRVNGTGARICLRAGDELEYAASEAQCELAITTASADRAGPATRGSAVRAVDSSVRIILRLRRCVGHCVQTVCVQPHGILYPTQ